MRILDKKPFRTMAFALLGFSCGACNLNEFTVNTTAPVLKIGSVALDRESDIQFAKEAAPASLLTVASFLVASPENEDLLEILAKGYTQYTFGLLEPDLDALEENGDPEQVDALRLRCTTFYDRAYGFAVRLAALHDEQFPDEVKGDLASLKGVLQEKFKKAEDAPGLYWTGMALGSAINLNKDDIDRVADLPKAIALLERVHEIAPEYFNHGAALSLGVVYASRGKAMGGNPELAKQMFDEVIQATGGKYLMAKVLYARFYATAVQDRALFEKTLSEVNDTPADVWPDQRLANELAKRRAVTYLAQVDDLFLGGDEPAPEPPAAKQPALEQPAPERPAPVPPSKPVSKN